MILLLSNESELVSSNEGKIVLTNQRIHMSDREWGNAYSITIFLEDISSIEMHYKSNMMSFILGIISGISCFYLYASGSDDTGAGISFVLTAIFFIFYWVTRRHIVSITSHGGKSLNFEANSLPDYEMQKFLNRVQEAKLQRSEQLRSLNSLAM